MSMFPSLQTDPFRFNGLNTCCLGDYQFGSISLFIVGSVPLRFPLFRVDLAERRRSDGAEAVAPIALFETKDSTMAEATSVRFY
jgi:hypothetical protein